MDRKTSGSLASLEETTEVFFRKRPKISTQSIRVELPPGQKLVKCQHPSGEITILKGAPAVRKTAHYCAELPIKLKSAALIARKMEGLKITRHGIFPI